jgi:mRNA-degrading endonuclease RelE of RelBE toxin-antitoxin system
VQILYHPRAIKHLKKIPKAELKKISLKIEKLSQNPRVGKQLQGELCGLFSLRAWPYLIIYEINGNTLIICSVAHRQGVYQKSIGTYCLI